MQNLDSFKGIFPALLTPFDQKDRINAQALRQDMDYNLKKGVSGFYVAGSTAEVFLLETEEREELYRICAEHNRKRVTLIGHVGDLCLNRAKKYARLCESLGYDAVSAVTPFYYKYSPEEIVAYYKELAASCGLPLILYYFPDRAGVRLTAGTFAELLSDEQFIGVKFTTNDFFTFERMRDAFPDKIFYNGYDEMLLSGLAMGADGAIGSTYNLMAEKFIEIFRLCKGGNFAAALPIQHRANDIITSLLETGNILPTLKSALTQLVGIDMGSCRAPGAPSKEAFTAWATHFCEKYRDEFIPFQETE